MKGSAVTRTYTPAPAPRFPDTGTPPPPPSLLLFHPERSALDSLTAALATIGLTGALTSTEPEQIADWITQVSPGDLAVLSVSADPTETALVHTAREAGWGRVLVLTTQAATPVILESIRTAISGLVIDDRIHRFAQPGTASGHDLTEREIQVIEMVADGRTNKWIGEALDLSALTVKSHLARIGRKLGTGDRAHIVATALRIGVIE